MESSYWNFTWDIAAALLQAHTLGKDGVIEEAAHPTDGHLFRPTIAADAVLWLVVRTTPGVFVLMALKPDVALLAPLTSPRVQNEPVLVARLLAVALGQHRMTQNRVLGTSVEHTRVVIEPAATVHRHDDGAVLDKSLHERFNTVAWELVPAGNNHPLGGGPWPRKRRWTRTSGPLIGQFRLCWNAVIPHEGIRKFTCGSIAAA
mmetsp:Transcript_68521/g.149102  ORF Transcript_68521/g.149102 Transcript_68521/m.149102 type:complete len:204 (-) Transcript_68521:710-1321(-)